MAGVAIANARPPLPPVRPSTRAAILIAVLLLHVAAILLLLSRAAEPPATRTERALAVFDVVVPPPPAPAPPPPKPPRPEKSSTVKTRPAPPATTVDPGGSAPPPRDLPRAPTFAPVVRENTFDMTASLDAPSRATGAAPLPGLLDGGGGQGGNGRGQGRGDGIGDGRGGNGGGPGFRRARWIYQPGWQEMMLYFPAIAKEAKQSGQVLLACHVPRAGKPESCRAIAENPTAMGFGEAAVRLSATFRMRPAYRNNAIMTDLPIIIPVVFSLKGVAVPPPPPCPPPYCRPVAGYREALAAGRVE